MNGIHDMGGMHGFGAVEVEADEPVFHQRWEGRALAIATLTLLRTGNVDTFRHAIERLDPVTYLSVGYYGRWLRAVETLLAEGGLLAPGAVDARLRGEIDVDVADPPEPPPYPAAPSTAVRAIGAGPRFAPGDRVRARNLQPAGHTRLPGYARGRRGEIARVHPACVLPDTHAHGRGEHPQYVYAVRFSARDLWGDDADARAAVHVDLFESYLEPA